MGLVLEQEEPVFALAIHIDLHLDGAGIDLLRFVEAGEHAVLLEPLRTDRAHVHEAHGFLVAAELMAHRHVLVEGGLHHGVVDFNGVELGAESGVAAVVGPIRVDHLDLGDGGISLLTLEILAYEPQIGLVHCQAPIGDELGKLCIVHFAEAIEHFDRLGGGGIGGERLSGLQPGFAGLHRIDHVLFDRGEVVVAQLAIEHIHAGRAHGRSFALADELDAFACGIRALVELAGQRFHRKHRVTGDIRQFDAHIVHLRLAEYGGDRLAEQLLADSLDVIPVDDADVVQRFNAENRAQFVRQLLRLDVESGLLLYMDAKNHCASSFFSNNLGLYR